MVNNIVTHFDKKYNLERNTFSYYKETILNILKNYNCFNYRILIFALQKVIDYFGESINNRNGEFFHVVLSSVLKFAIQERAQVKSGGFSDNQSLGIYNLKNYVNGDISVIEDIDFFEERYVNYLNECKINKYVNNLIEIKLKYWFRCSQDELEKTINEIYDNINNGTINYSYYKDIMYFLLPLKQYVDNSDLISAIGEKCLENITNQEIDVEKLLEKQFFGYDMFIGPNNDKYIEYKKFLSEYNRILNEKQKEVFNNENIYKSMYDFCKYISDNEKNIHQSHMLLSSINLKVLIELVKNSNSSQIIKLRTLLQSFYKIGNVKEVFPNDKSEINELLDNCRIISNIERDKIKKQNIEWFINDLMDYNNLYK